MAANENRTWGIEAPANTRAGAIGWEPQFSRAASAGMASNLDISGSSRHQGVLSSRRAPAQVRFERTKPCQQTREEHDVISTQKLQATVQNIDRKSTRLNS